jgi:hypothetical protein
LNRFGFSGRLPQGFGVIGRLLQGSGHLLAAAEPERVVHRPVEERLPGRDFTDAVVVGVAHTGVELERLDELAAADERDRHLGEDLFDVRGAVDGHRQDDVLDDVRIVLVRVEAGVRVELEVLLAVVRAERNQHVAGGQLRDRAGRGPFYDVLGQRRDVVHP